MTAQEKRQVQRCNDLFDRELGQKQFAWKRGVELEISMQLIDPDTGVPKYDNKMNRQTGIIEVVNVYARRKMLEPQYWGSWVVCQLLVPDMDEDQYNNYWQGKLEYPRNGTWTPIQDSTLKPGILPDLALTEMNIAAIKAFKQEFDAHVDKMVIKQNLRKAQERVNKEDYFRDRMPAFGQVPGTKSHTSYPYEFKLGVPSEEVKQKPAQECAIEV